MRYLIPVINLYTVVFLAGGAVVSAWRFSKSCVGAALSLGNALIAVGAILSEVGRSLAKSGLVEALYLAELIGLSLLWGHPVLGELADTQCGRAPGGLHA